MAAYLTGHPTGRIRRRRRCRGPRPAGRSRGRADPGPVLRQGHRDRPVETLTPLINGPDTPDLAHQVGEVGAWARGNGVPCEISARPSSARAPTPPTRTSPGPRRSPARPRATVCGPGRSSSSRPDPSRSGPPSSATGSWPISRPSAPRCWPTPAALHRPVGPRPTSTRPSVNTIVNSLQPQLPEAQRRQRRHQGVRGLARHGHRLRLAGTLDFNPLTDSIT
jgi:hypothetical protein